MPTEIFDTDPKELRIIRSGNRITALFFLILGLMFQILFVWGLLTFAEASGIWALLTLGVIQSELFPYLSIVFMFGGGCLLVALREVGWMEYTLVKNGKEGRIILGSAFLRWKREQEILKNQVQVIRIHIIPLDMIGMVNRYQLEMDYEIAPGSDLSTLLIFVDKEGNAKTTVSRLASKVHLLLGEEIKFEELIATPPVAE
ncbi:MAG: hypothetical protein ACFFE8_13145 [Candidatus Heimdallarchaeota archaeon]